MWRTPIPQAIYAGLCIINRDIADSKSEARSISLVADPKLRNIDILLVSTPNTELAYNRVSGLWIAEINTKD